MCCILLNFHAEAQIVVGQEGSEELRQHWFRVTDAQQNKTFILFNLLQVRAVYAVVDVKTHVLQECLQCRGNGDGAPFSTHFRSELGQVLQGQHFAEGKLRKTQDKALARCSADDGRLLSGRQKSHLQTLHFYYFLLLG